MIDPVISRQIDERLLELYERHLPLSAESVASYYESGRGSYGTDPGDDIAGTFGVAFADLEGELHCVGDHDKPFALQSIAKVFAFLLALEDHGRDQVLRHVGVEPSGDAFNSIVFDERNNRPYNPMVNAGALVTSHLVR